VARAYGVPVVGEGSSTTESVRARVVRGRPNWWVILAVSLALMALLVATSGNEPSRGHRTVGLGAAASHDAHGAGGARHTARPPAPSSTTTTSPVPERAGSSNSANPTTGGTSSLASNSRIPDNPGSPDTAATVPPTTTTVPPPTTTTTGASVVQPADRNETEGYLEPPLQTSKNFEFPGTGAMQVVVLWSGDTYLNLSVSCPSGNQTEGGTGAVQASLPDASGECDATVSEPASESTTLTFTITFEPAGG
jgi:hypothetical protein